MARQLRWGGNLLLALGLASLLLAGYLYFSDPSRGSRVLPAPVALGSGPDAASQASLDEPTATQTPAPPTSTPIPAVATASPTPARTATPTVTPTATPVPTPVFPAETATRIVIPGIQVDSKVQDAGTYWENGQLLWQTLPWIVAHYNTTAKPGQKGNGVYSGHVTSRSAGNVFSDLYKVQLGDEVVVYTRDYKFTYQVRNVRVVLPTETSVMNPTPDPSITLITCSGEWIPDEHQYTHRLVVQAKLIEAEEL